MGQIISNRMMLKVPKSLSKAIQNQESAMAKDALEDIARKKLKARAMGAKYTDPSAMQGFKREGSISPREREQQDFWKGVSGDAPQEMPEDLIKFLNDAGPLERKVDKSMTSPKVYDSLLQDEEIRRQQMEEAKQRKRRIMPMVESMNTELDASQSSQSADGMTTSRTTNFSTAIRKQNSSQMKLLDLEVFQLINDFSSVSPSESIDRDGSDGGVDDNSDIVRQFENYFSSDKKTSKRRITSGAVNKDDDNSTTFSSLTNEQKEENAIMLQNAIKYTVVPVIMEDTDKSLVGALSDKVEALQLMRLKVVSDKDRVRLALELELEENKKGNPVLETLMAKKTENSRGLKKGNGNNSSDFGKETFLDAEEGKINSESSFRKANEKIQGRNGGSTTAEFLQQEAKRQAEQGMK